MAKKVSIILIVLLTFSFYCSCACVTTPSSNTGTIDVSSSPQGAEVYLDNQYKGTTPVVITGVSPGEHIIELRASGFETWRAKGTMVEGGSEKVSASLVPISTSQSVTSQPVYTQQATPAFTQIPVPSPISFSGSGKRVTNQFPLTTGISIFDMKHTGNSNYAIWLMDSNGNRLDLLVNEIGDFSGKKAIGITEADNYIMDITADGSWSVKIEQPRPTSAPSTRTFSGTGKAVSGFFTLDSGLAIFDMTHTGYSNYAIWLMDSNGRRIDLLANEIGNYNGQKALGITREGIYLMDITADGPWSINIR